MKREPSFNWVNCPNCGRKYFKSYGDYRLEVMCNGCKGKYLVWQDGNENCHEQVAPPRRHGYGPKEYK